MGMSSSGIRRSGLSCDAGAAAGGRAGGGCPVRPPVAPAPPVAPSQPVVSGRSQIDALPPVGVAIRPVHGHRWGGPKQRRTQPPLPPSEERTTVEPLAASPSMRGGALPVRSDAGGWQAETCRDEGARVVMACQRHRNRARWLHSITQGGRRVVRSLSGRSCISRLPSAQASATGEDVTQLPGADAVPRRIVRVRTNRTEGSTSPRSDDETRLLGRSRLWPSTESPCSSRATARFLAT